jgi:hypothetical protein
MFERFDERSHQVVVRVGEGEGLIALEALRISPGDLRARHDA